MRKVYPYLAGALVLAAIAVIRLIDIYAGAIVQAMRWIFIGAGVIILAVLVHKGLQVYHGLHMNHLERRSLKHEIRRSNEELEHRKHIETQALMNTHEIELERVRLAQMQAANEHYRLTTQIELAPGHMALFPQDNYRMIQAPHKPLPAIEQVDGKAKALPAPAIEPPVDFPGEYDLLEIFRRANIAPDNIFLAKGNGAAHIWVDAQTELCHGIFSAITGRGKTVLERGIESQLLTCTGIEVYHLDLKFTLIDEKGLDYRPIAKRLLEQGEIEIQPGVHVSHLITDIKQIYAFLFWLARVEIPARLELYHQGIHTYKLMYVFLEELLYLISKYKEAAPLICDIIVIGRALGVKLFTAAQNFQAQNTNISGGMSENFETAYYMGGDNESGAKVLDVAKKDLTEYLARHHLTLGKSLALLRNNSVAPQATLARIGMASNEAVYYLLYASSETLRNRYNLLLLGIRLYVHFSRVIPQVQRGSI